MQGNPLLSAAMRRRWADPEQRARLASRTPLTERFWAKVEKAPGDACWLWTGARRTSGYGEIGLGGRGEGVESAHRLSWTLAYGLIPDGMQVLHRCDVRLCVRPDHLFLGSAADNSADMVAKRRNRTGPPRWGAESPGARLTASQAEAIRRAYAGGETQESLAARYGVSQPLVGRVVRGLSYRNAAGPTVSRGRVRRKLTGDQVREVRALREQGQRQEEIAARLGVSRGPVSRILRGLAYRDA